MSLQKKKKVVKFQKKEEEEEEMEKKCFNAAKIKGSQGTRFSSTVTKQHTNQATHELIFSLGLQFLFLKGTHMQGGWMPSSKKETEYEAKEST